MKIMKSNFELELAGLINKYSRENDSDTPDFMLAEYLVGCLKIFGKTVQRREHWYGRMKKNLLTFNKKV